MSRRDKKNPISEISEIVGTDPKKIEKVLLMLKKEFASDDEGREDARTPTKGVVRRSSSPPAVPAPSKPKSKSLKRSRRSSEDEEEEEEKEWEYSHIRNMRIVDGAKEYLVVWKGKKWVGHDSWLPLENLRSNAKHAIADFEKLQRRAQAPAPAPAPKHQQQQQPPRRRTKLSEMLVKAKRNGRQ